MRRKDREITDLNQIFEVIDRCSVARLGMIDNGKPYVVALNFGYERQGDALVLYFHSALEGRKIDALRANPDVYFQMSCGDELIPGSDKNPCAYGWRYDSVMGSGQVEFLDDPADKTHALNCMIRHLGKREATFIFPEAGLQNTCVYRICTTDFSCKHHD